MKRSLIPCALVVASATFAFSTSKAETIECASEPAAARGHWYYRLIDGRKCWYQGKPMMPKSSLSWKKSSDVEAKETAAVPPPEAAKPATDGRGVSAPPRAEPVGWPTPAANDTADDTSFESRWRGLKPNG